MENQNNSFFFVFNFAFGNNHHENIIVLKSGLCCV